MKKNKIKNNYFKISLVKILIVFAVIGIDLLTKHFFYGKEVSFIPFLVGGRSCSLNTGGAWSILNDKMWLLVVMTFVFLTGVIIFDVFTKNTNWLYSIAIAFIFGGAVGNLLDRLFLGGVRDFIFFEFLPSFPTFNVADSFLCIGIFLLIIYIIFFYKPSEEKNTIKKN